MFFTVELVDSQGRTSTKQVVMDPSVTTIADAQTFYTAWETLFKVISGMGVQGATLSVPLTVVASTAQAASNKDEGVQITLPTTGGGRFTDRIPAPAKTAGIYDYVVGGVVDVENEDIVDYYAQFLAAGDGRFGRYSERSASAAPSSGYLETK